ncbi:MAG: hypothetical protein H9W81_03305 [Enterococcus sp.]|nr:hypothetical protein [Enterococcus sp.]
MSLWPSQMEKVVEYLSLPETGTQRSRSNAEVLCRVVEENLDSKFFARDAASAILERLGHEDDIGLNWFADI